MAERVVAPGGGNRVEPNRSVASLRIALLLGQLFSIFAVRLWLVWIERGQALGRDGNDQLIKVLFGKRAFATLSAG